VAPRTCWKATVKQLVFEDTLRIVGRGRIEACSVVENVGENDGVNEFVNELLTVVVSVNEFV